MQAKLLHARRIDQIGARVEVIEPRMRRRMPARIERRRNLRRRGIGAGYQRIDDRRFPHAGLADQHADLSVERRPQRRYVLLGRQWNDAIAQAGVKRQAIHGRRAFSRQVELVQHDDQREPLILRRSNAAIQQLFVKTRHDGQHDDDLRNVGGNQFLAELVGAVEQCGAWIDGFDHTLPFRRARDFDSIPARQRAALAARKTREHFRAGEFDQVLAAERTDDDAVMQGRLRAQRSIIHNANRRGRGGFFTIPP